VVAFPLVARAVTISVALKNLQPSASGVAAEGAEGLSGRRRRKEKRKPFPSRRHHYGLGFMHNIMVTIIHNMGAQVLYIIILYIIGNYT
jgi:hypothetical protein